MGNKAVFLDRDGTINIDKDYLYRIEDFEYKEGVLDVLRILQDMGYLLIIITNQSGIARGYYTEDDFKKLNDWMLADLEKKGIHISGVYYCPHLPNAKIKKYRINCKCRKPGIELFEKAAIDFDIDLDESIAIGDKERDLCICNATKVRGFLVNRNKGDLYSLYEYSDRVTNVCISEQFPSILNYYRTGLMTKEELVEALLHR